MTAMIARVEKFLVLFCVGGLAYSMVELLARGYTHWSMFFVGGLCFVLVGGLNNWIPWEMSIIKQMLISAVIITAVEFGSGMILNVWLGWNVWDYSDRLGNIMGQICPLFSLYWFLLSIVAIVLDDVLRWKWFGEQAPEYHLFSQKQR